MTPTYFAGIIKLYLPEPQASLMNGILLGIPLKNQWFLYQDLISVGLVHMIVLSGMNITLLSEMVSRALFFLPKHLRIGTIIITIVSFSFFVGVQPPIARAALMGILSLVGSLIGRKVSPVYSLLVSAVICLWVYPGWISSLSFYLSYAATSGIILVPKPFKVKVVKGKVLTYFYHYCVEDLQTSLAAQLFTAPLIWFYFGRISLISPITNLLVSWTVAPITLMGALFCLAGPYGVHVLKPVVILANVLISYILWVVRVFA